MKKLFFLLVLILSVNIIFSQDKIYRNNGKIVLAKVIEIGPSEIKYRDFNNPDGPIYILESDRINKIIFENGKVERFEDNLKDPERYAGQSNRGIKINFLSPLYGYFELGYEKNTAIGRGYEFSLGIIGAGKSERLYFYNSQLGDVKRDQAGAFVSGGFKFGKLPDFLIFGKSKASHLMQGTYAKPSAYFGHYKENIIIEKANNISEVGKQNVTFGALQVELGRQWVLGDILLLDLYYGIGYGIDNKKDTYQYYNNSTYYFEDASAFNYANGRVGKSPGLSFTGGLKLGLLLKNKQAEKTD